MRTPSFRALALVATALESSLLLGCGESDGGLSAGVTSASSVGPGGTGVGGATAATTSTAQNAGSSGAGGAWTGGCVEVGANAEVVIATAPGEGEHALSLTALSADTDWSELGNEALVLDVLGDAGLIGHLVLHQGATEFTYGMHVGSLKSGEPLRVRVSTLSADGAEKKACVGTAALIPAASLGVNAEGLKHAPIFKWPVKKRFDDLPLMLGWSHEKARYQAVYSNENGGTVAICGAKATGMQAELARWGRGADIEGVYSYGGTEKWERCDGMKTFAQVQPGMEAEHPIFYYGDGHNRVFESRGGYGKTCGSSADQQADGDLSGWNVNNPGNQPKLDDGLVIVLRPLPVDLDALGYATFAGRREGLMDTYAPWLYRLTFAELAREGNIDQNHTFPMQSYLFVDVHAADVGGSGDSYCSFMVGSGFRLRVHTKDGETLDGPQMTASYFGASEDIKRIAIELKKTYAANAFDGLEFDAYDNDGIYWLGLGDAFMARPVARNGATLDYVHKGTSAVNTYIDDDKSGCNAGVNMGGPGAFAYPCVGGKQTFALP